MEKKMCMTFFFICIKHNSYDHVIKTRWLCDVDYLNLDYLSNANVYYF